MRKISKGIILVFLFFIGISLQLGYAVDLPDGAKTFNGATVNDDGSIDTEYHYFNLTASRDGLAADKYGAFIQDSSEVTETVYFELATQNGLDNFQLDHIYMGDYDDANNGSYYDVTVTGYLEGTQVFQTTPYTKTNETNEVDLNIDYSVTIGQPIDRFRITYTIQAGTSTTHSNFNILNFTIANSSAAPAVLYTVTFKDYNGNVLKTESVYSGYGATAPTEPTRDDYVFAGWDNEFSNIGSDLTVTATYTQQHTVTFVDPDNNVISTVTVNDGEAATAPTPPERTGYTFSNWNVDYSNVTTDLTVTAQYTINSYTVTFKDYNGDFIQDQSVEYGSAATAPADPTRTGYVFNGWDKTFTNITADLTVTATYIQTHTVTFVDPDNNVISTVTVNDGEAATAPTPPARTGYTFSSWNEDYSNVTTDITVTAQYTINSYTVTFKDYNGDFIQDQSVEYGSAATAPSDPTRTGYTFSSWNVDYSNVTTDLIVTAQYTINSYTVTFKDYNGDFIQDQSVEYGSAATAPSDPTRTGYTFSSWNVDYSNVTTDLIVTAQYTINSYTVTFKDYNGDFIQDQSVEYGSAATAPSDPTRTGYTFSSWNEDYSNVTTDLTVTAQYTINSYTVTFEDYNGDFIQDQSVEYGSAATAPADPTRTGYTFTGWDVAYTNITGALTVTAQYTINKLYGYL
jgi:uncharacterized repeat protein (TIGR02543 family)